MSNTPIVDRCFACGHPCELPVMVDVYGVPQPVCSLCVDRTVAACRRLCQALAEAFASAAEAFRTSCRETVELPLNAICDLCECPFAAPRDDSTNSRSRCKRCMDLAAESLWAWFTSQEVTTDDPSCLAGNPRPPSARRKTTSEGDDDA